MAGIGKLPVRVERDAGRSGKMILGIFNRGGNHDDQTIFRSSIIKLKELIKV